MLLYLNIVADKNALEDIMEKALTDMEETDVRGRIRRATYFYFKMHSISLG